MSEERVHRMLKQIQFLTEIDKLKGILRQSPIINENRRENDAEHSWHFAMMAIVLLEYAKGEDIDLLRVIKMALVHDIVEIDAGDAFVYDPAANIGKEEREQAAADRIFNILPIDQSLEMRGIWDEFEERKTPEALYAATLDRLQPILLNYTTGGRGWRVHGISRSQAIDRNKHMADGSPELWEFALRLIDSAAAQGFLRDE